MAEKYYVYILHCADNTYYTGITNNVERRLREHEEGTHIDSYTYPRRPLSLVWYEAFQTPMKAIEVEKQIKGWSRKKKEALIKGQFPLLQELASCQNGTHYSREKKSK